MADRYRMIVIDADIESVTGHHKVQVQVDHVADNGDVTGGTPEMFGIDASVLQSVYGGDEQRWLREYVAQELIRRHKTRTAVHYRLLEMKGKVVDLGEV